MGVLGFAAFVCFGVPITQIAARRGYMRASPHYSPHRRLDLQHVTFVQLLKTSTTLQKSAANMLPVASYYQFLELGASCLCLFLPLGRRQDNFDHLGSMHGENSCMDLVNLQTWVPRLLIRIIGTRRAQGHGPCPSASPLASLASNVWSSKKGAYTAQSTKGST